MSITITVDVTQADIERGVRRDCQACPIALALRRALATETAGEWDDFDVDNEITFRLGGRERLAEMPREAVDFVHDFDAWRRVKPFSFDLVLPDLPDVIDSIESEDREYDRASAEEDALYEDSPYGQ